jgi:hypothetical protein
MNELQTTTRDEAERITRARELGLPTTAAEALTDLQKINQQWVEACTSAMDECPASFVTKFTDIMFTGQRLITEARIVAQIEAHKAALANL